MWIFQPAMLVESNFCRNLLPEISHRYPKQPCLMGDIFIPSVLLVCMLDFGGVTNNKKLVLYYISYRRCIERERDVYTYMNLHICKYSLYCMIWYYLQTVLHNLMNKEVEQKPVVQASPRVWDFAILRRKSCKMTTRRFSNGWRGHSGVEKKEKHGEFTVWWVLWFGW